jgi:hypothetical protein
MAPRRTLRSVLPVLVLVLLLPLNACGGPAGAEGGSASSGSSATATQASAPDPRPTPASSKGPARNLPKPVLPEVAKQNTKEGFEAFTQYWFDVATYAIENKDPESLKAISRADCKVCGVYTADAMESTMNESWAEGPRYRVIGFMSDMSLDPLRQALGQFLLEESPSSTFDSQGRMLKFRKGGNDNRLKEIYAIYDDGRWLASQLGQA